MNIQGLQATYRRLYKESPTWKLLRAENVAQILAFISYLFVDDNEVAYSRGRHLLDQYLKACRDNDTWQTENNAAYYLNLWIKEGWLREMDDMLSKTDASETVLRFCKGLQEPSSSTTATHLKIVQDAVRDFVVAVSEDVDERVALLQQKKAAIQREIDDLTAGVVTQLTEAQQRERIREIYQLASILTGDFRRVEDEIRQLDRSLRINMIEDNTTRAAVLQSLIQQEQLLAASDSGSAFDGFCQLLQDQDRSNEFRAQLRSILNHPAALLLAESQRQFLGQLMRELTKESDRVFQVRRRTEEGLRSFIESGAVQENRLIDQLLTRLEKTAMQITAQQMDLKTPLQQQLNLATVQISSPESLALKSPYEHMDTRGVQVAQNAKTLSSQMLTHLESVQVRVLAAQTYATLAQKGAMTIARLSQEQPLKSGLEELVAYMRIAKAIKAPLVAELTEHVQFQDQHGICLQATIPMYVLNADLFPSNLDELAL